ncbi:hypothetical protein Zmor_028395 [Zophobas morio]|uniref:Uncharacterized protein n=1 Tax=Zophobas morio TaxID=2755281 RepID=A0AA38HPW5_9CUCU|nr:hypothetical protein Zmor_028395 [Zophobas morio]
MRYALALDVQHLGGDAVGKLGRPGKAGRWRRQVVLLADSVFKQRPTGPLATGGGFLVELVVDGFSHQGIGVLFSFPEGSEGDFVQELLQRREVGLSEQLGVSDEPWGFENLSENFRLDDFQTVELGFGGFIAPGH